MAKINEVLIKKPKTNTFNSRPKITFTGNIGELIPAHWQLLLPGDKVEVKSDCVVKFPPLTTSAFARMKVLTETFFVPLSQISDNFEEFVSNIKKESKDFVQNGEKYSQSVEHDGCFLLGDLVKFMTNHLDIDVDPSDHFEINGNNNVYQKNAVARLCNAIGIPQPIAMNPFAYYGNALVVSPKYQSFAANFGHTAKFEITQGSREMSLLKTIALDGYIGQDLEQRIWLNPFRAYQHIYNTYYRDAQLHPQVDLYSGSVYVHSISDLSNISNCKRFFRVFNNLCQMRYRCYKKDVFNTAVTDPTLGAQAIAVPSNVLDLRKANIVQKVLEKRALCGSRFADFLLQHFGTSGNNYELDRPLFLSRSESFVQISETLQTSESTPESVQGTLSGNANSYSDNKGFYFSAPDYGILMTIVSVVPDICYIGGLPRKLNIRDWESLPLPEFSNIGMQSIRSSEVALPIETSFNHNDNGVFGYAERYVDYKFEPDRVFGDFETTLNYWHQYPNMQQYYIGTLPTQDRRLPVVGFHDPLNYANDGVLNWTNETDISFPNQIFNVMDNNISDHCLFSLAMSITKNTPLSVNSISV